MRFIDEVKLHLRSGNGGGGCLSFRREKFVSDGGPDGGNGGHGGSIIFESSDSINTLINFRYKRHFTAQRGKNGQGANCTGRSAPSLVLLVPIGTQVLSEDGLLIVDFLSHGQRFEILKGGEGGLGNAMFKTSTNRAPRMKTSGQEGQELVVLLELKLIADVGLIGLPNAGKSTLLSVLSNARPKIGDYPFTTLSPNLGIVQIYDDTEFVLADIPGLIEGAHEGHGLGLTFLRHIERCKVLLHLIDVSGDVCHDYKTVRNEISMHSGQISNKPELICLTKCDVLDDDEVKHKVQQLQHMTGSRIYYISAHTKQWIDELKHQIFLHLSSVEQL